ncbi:unnamed protein product [Rhizophagus irregularis]|nr:unnamed protein product [Rhizophagus irregularis]
MKDTSRQKVSFLICFLKVIKRLTFRPTKKSIGQSQELIIESQKVIENIVEIEIDGQDQVVMTIVKIEADGQEDLNTIGKSSSDYEPSDNELARKYYKKKEQRNEDQLASLLQDDKVKGLFEEFLKNKLNEPSNTNHELEYPEGRDQTSQEDQDRTRSQSRTQEEDRDRTRSQSRTQEEDQDRTRSQSRTQEDQDLTRSQSRTQEDQGRIRSQSRTHEEAQDHTRSQSRTQEDQGRGRSRGQSRTWEGQGRSRGQSRTREGQGHSRGQSRTREDQGHSRGQSRTREDQGRSRTKPAVRSLRRNRFQRQAARDRSLRRIRSRTRSTSSSNLSHNDPKYIYINDLPQDLRNAIRLRYFLRDYIDRIFSESSKVPKKRTRIHDSVNFYDKERTKPFQAPNWTISGYTGSLKTAVQKACIERSSNTLPARV